MSRVAGLRRFALASEARLVEVSHSTRRVMTPHGARASVPKLSLKHGQAVSVLSQLGFRSGSSDASFNEYLKSLRRFGIPFSERELDRRSGRLVYYHYENLMELAVALALRVHRVHDDDRHSGGGDGRGYLGGGRCGRRRGQGHRQDR